MQANQKLPHRVDPDPIVEQVKDWWREAYGLLPLALERSPEVTLHIARLLVKYDTLLQAAMSAEAYRVWMQQQVAVAEMKQEVGK